MKLLIVDDEIFAIQGILNGVNWDELGFEEILQANSYAQAVSILSRQRVEVVLCDIEMPDESGLTLIEWIRDHDPETVSIILSCHDEFDYARQAIKLDCLEYVTKPVRYDYLTQLLARAVRLVKEARHHRELEDYGKMYIKSIYSSGHETTQDIVETVTQYIDTHLSEDLNVTVLAKIGYVSPDHLTRVFKKKRGQTVSEYIKQKRMDMAKHLLRDEHMTITAVADTVGYSNYSYFIEQFKKYTGVTPKAFQKNKDEE